MTNGKIMKFTFLLLFMWCAFGNTQKTCHEDIKSVDFHIINSGISRLTEGILFELNVLEMFHCAISCLKTRFCFAYNYKMEPKPNETNCQLTHRMDHRFERVSNGDNDWTIYKVAGKRVSTCGEIDPSCPKNHERELCEILDVSCTTLKSKYPYLPDGQYNINPRGPDLPALSIYCDMTAKNGIGVTEIGHDSEQKTEVTGNGAGKPFYGRNITYGINMTEIVSIINESRYCEQFIKYECQYSWILRSGYGWWVSRQGKRMNYWGGAAIDSGKCACGTTNTCRGGSSTCNCDTYSKELSEDSGYLSDKNTLPVTQLRFGDTDRSSERGFHTLGKLRCWG